MTGDLAKGQDLSRAPLLGSALMTVGLAILAVTFVVPYATNEAGCLDHCAEPGSYYVWHPLHNPGAPFLLIGMVSSVLLWRRPGWRYRGLAWLGVGIGWLGLLGFLSFAPAYLGELYLYGGPDLEVRATRWVVAAGWAVVQAGTVVHAHTSSPHRR